MKKLLYFVVSLLSLSIIFAAGWASGVGTVTDKQNLPAAVNSDEITDECPECPEDEECPDDQHTEPGKNIDIHRRGFKMKLPVPPFDRDTIRPPKTVN